MLADLKSKDTAKRQMAAVTLGGVGGAAQDKVVSALAEALKSPELRDMISKDGGDVVASTPEALGAHLQNEIARYAKVIKAGNIRAD